MVLYGMARKSPLRDARENAELQGLERFGEGIPCRIGHLEGRFTSSGRCVRCVREFSAKGRIKNSDYHAEYGKKYREENKASAASYASRYYNANKEALVAYKEAYYLKNREAILEKVVAYRTANVDSLRLTKVRERAMRGKRSVRWGSEQAIRLREREVVLLGQIKSLEEYTGCRFQIDHMLPLKGKLVCGLHVWNNLQVIPQSLNSRKRNKLILTEVGTWMLALGRHEVMQESADDKESEKFYSSLGWDFKKECYTTGPYAGDK